MRIAQYLVAGLVTLGGTNVAFAACPNNTQTTIVFGNGFGTTEPEAQAELDNVLMPHVLRAIDPAIDLSCIDFQLAYDSNFVDSDNALVNTAIFVDQMAIAMAQLGIDFAANFWSYWDFIVEPPTKVQEIQRTLITSATSIFQPNLLIHERFYNGEIALGHNIVVVAHSQGNLYVNPAYSVVTSLGGQELFHIVSLATPAPSVQDPGGKYFKLFRDVLALVGLPPNISNGPPSPCLLLLGSIACHSFAESYMADRDDPAGDKSDTTRSAIVGAVLGFLPTQTAVSITDAGQVSGLTFVYPEPVSSTNVCIFFTGVDRSGIEVTHLYVGGGFSSGTGVAGRVDFNGSIEQYVSQSNTNGSYVVGAYLSMADCLNDTDALRRVTFYRTADNPFVGTQGHWTVGVLNQLPKAGFAMTTAGQPPVSSSPPAANVPTLTVIGAGNCDGCAIVTLNGASPNSFDPDGTITGWQWTLIGFPSVTTSTLSGSFSPGTYSILLVVTDNQGSSSQPAQATLIVSPLIVPF